MADGVVSSVNQTERPERMETTRGKVGFRDWLRWYLGAALAGVIVAFGIGWLFGIHPLRAVFAVCGAMFMAAAVDRPPMAFRVLRNTGWFACVRTDATIRLIIGVIALWLLAVALLLPPGTFAWPR